MGNECSVPGFPDGSTTSTVYSANTATVTDPAGKTLKTTTDAFGRATKVEEDLSGFAYATQYEYDPLGDLTKVTQGTQVRNFYYDNQGWLQSSAQPESGTTSYTYDVVGNVATKKDNRQITTYFTYDALNRLTQKTYSDSTPPVSYSYDTAGVAYAIGRLTQMASNGTYTSNQAFDPLGNVTAGSQLTASKLYPFSYTYNLAGALTSEMLPSGRKLTYGYDGAGRENYLSGTIGGQPKNYVGYVSYTPDNQVNLVGYGNNVWHATNYNSRLQAYETFDVINNDINKLLRSSCLYWGSSYNLSTCGATNNTDNNGALRATVSNYGTGGPTPTASFNETFAYDGMNRLTGVVDSGGWSRYFGYDQHGNMWLCGWPGLPPNGSAPAATYCSQNSSSLFNGANQIAGSSYDAAGNLLSVTGSSLTYDAENRLTGATQSGIGSMYYSYDGAGRRVQEISTYNTEKVFVYDAFGRLSAEYSTGMPAPPCTTCYIAADHLGSTRLVTDQNGNTVGRHDYVPFGEEIAANSGGRDSTFGTSDFVNQKFTGQERDSETGLDFFQARYFSGALGRFNSPDPGNAGANLFSPQSWNGYTYAYNNPLTLIDPSGTSPFDGFNPSPDDPCADDPFICGYPGFPDFPFPWPSEQPQPQPQPPPPPPATIVIPHTGGVFAQGQYGNGILAGVPVAVGAGGGIEIAIDLAGGTICVASGVCEIIAIGAGAVAIGAGAYIIYKRMNGKTIREESSDPNVYRGRTNVADTGITAEAQELVSSGKFPSICAALAFLQSQTRDSARLQKIKATQKAFGCRRNSTQS